jgi:hypothetical protein
MSKTDIEVALLLQVACEKFYWERLHRDIEKPRTLTYQFIKDKMKEQGRWKAKPRGVPMVVNLKKIERQSTTVDMYSTNTPQVSEDSQGEYSQ